MLRLLPKRSAKQKEEDEKRRNLIIIGVVSVIVIGLAVGLILKRRSGGSEEVAKDYGYASSEASPQTQASTVTSQLQILNQWTDDSDIRRKMSDEAIIIGMVLSGLSTAESEGLLAFCLLGTTPFLGHSLRRSTSSVFFPLQGPIQRVVGHRA